MRESSTWCPWLKTRALWREGSECPIDDLGYRRTMEECCVFETSTEATLEYCGNYHPVCVPDAYPTTAIGTMETTMMVFGWEHMITPYYCSFRVHDMSICPDERRCSANVERTVIAQPIGIWPVPNAPRWQMRFRSTSEDIDICLRLFCEII